MYIDIHSHNSKPAKGIFTVENLMAHEASVPALCEGMAFSVGIHPWFAEQSNYGAQLDFVKHYGGHSAVTAIGEAGFDTLKGAPAALQLKTFEEQVRISENLQKPLIIHCAGAWEELLSSFRRLKPAMPWLIHGFRGKKALAQQLVSKGMYLSLWHGYVLTPLFPELLRTIPACRLFLETDGSGADIRIIYEKTAAALGLTTQELKEQIAANCGKVFLNTIHVFAK
ncbi:MAG: TatD family hydrolase [Bacteroidales bacterium]|jgi:TatD DNase family protein|nr:TatD family hydrolase [Bacteroidales bacterium]